MKTACVSNLGEHTGSEIRMHGWIYGIRHGGRIAFLLFRDGTGHCQCVVEAAREDAYETSEHLTIESSVELTGTVLADERAPGGYEISVSSLQVLQKAEEYPIARKSHGIDFLMSQRHLWLRAGRQRALLRIRHTIEKTCRNFLDDQDFTLIDTPVLVRGAGEEAQSLFPVEYFGEQAYLTQTGQLHLECACMALGKVYCFGPTFRAEKSKTRRHLTEFWMIEPEIAFADLDAVMNLAEGMVCAVVGAVLRDNSPELKEIGRDPAALESVAGPFPRITYDEAVELLRSSDTVDRLLKEMEEDRAALAQMTDDLTALEARHESVSKAWKKEKLSMEITELRERMHELEKDLAVRPQHIESAKNFEWGKDLGGSDETIISRSFEKPVFVTDYPVEAKAFYMKQLTPESRTVRNMDLLAPDGYGEIIGGSQREDDVSLLTDRIEASGLDADDYWWYTDLRRYGSVPHGGFGLGIERTLSWICGLKHVREAIPFPRLMGKLGI